MEAEQIQALLDEMGRAGVHFDEPTLEFAIRRNLEAVATSFLEKPDDLERLGRFATAVDVAVMLPFKVRFWQPQNVFHEILRQRYVDFRSRADGGDESAQAWAEAFLALGTKLSVYVG